MACDDRSLREVKPQRTVPERKKFRSTGDLIRRLGLFPFPGTLAAPPPFPVRWALRRSANDSLSDRKIRSGRMSDGLIGCDVDVASLQNNVRD